METKSYSLVLPQLSYEIDIEQISYLEAGIIASTDSMLGFASTILTTNDWREINGS